MAGARWRDSPVESIALPSDITDSSEQLVEAMGLDGCSMVEFRRDRDGRRC